MKILDVLTESEDDRLIKRALDIYKAFRHGSFWTLDNNTNPVKIKYLLPKQPTRVNVNIQDTPWLQHFNPVDVKRAEIIIHDILVNFYDENGKELDTGNPRLHKKYSFFIDDYIKDLGKKFQVFDIRIIRY